MRRRSVLALIAFAAAFPGPVRPSDTRGPAEFLSAFVWRGDDPELGGMSGIAVTPDGAGFVALSDYGFWTRGRFRRDARGAIAGIEAPPLRPLQSAEAGRILPGRPDSEGLALAPDGSAYVAFEGMAPRVRRYAALDGPAENLPRPGEFRGMTFNASLESVAADARGWVYVLAERPRNSPARYPVYRFRDGRWDRAFFLPRRGGFAAVDATVGPDGRFYLLEREFRGLGGFATRVRRWALDGAGQPGPEEPVLETPGGRHDNIEGLSVWRDAEGRLRLTMIADDNFRFFLRTEIVEYRLPAGD